jgi:DNA-binding NarL/FixJ family response regulator
MVMEHYSRTRILLAHRDGLLTAGIAATLSAGDEFDVMRPDGDSDDSIASAWHSADVVIADYHTALEQMKNGKLHRRVLILSSEAGEARILHALELGAHGYLLSGCGADELVQSIRTIGQGGTALSPEVAESMAESLRSRPLTARELTVLRELMSGLSDKGIANRLSISVGTIKAHVRQILTKLNASGRAEAIAIAQRRGMILDSGGSCSTAPNSARNRLRRAPVAAQTRESLYVSASPGEPHEW